MKKLLNCIFFPFVSKKYSLENKWWHRLIKVIYITSVVLVFFGLYADGAYLTKSKIEGLTSGLLGTYFYNIAMQFLYYKVILYVAYGKK